MRVRAGWVVRASLAAALVVSAGCAQRSDPDDAALAAVIEEGVERGAEEDREDAVLDATAEQIDELNLDDLFARLSAAETGCIEDHPTFRAADFEAVLSDPDAVEARVALTRVLFECIEDPGSNEVFAGAMVAGLEAVTPSLALSVRESTCFMTRVVEMSDDPARLLVVFDQAEDFDIALEAMDRCFSEENLAVIRLEEGAGPQSYGEDERLDSMQDDCDAGDDRACDLLFMVSSAGSDYERVAMTCGGSRRSDESFCSPESQIDESGFSPADNPGLEVLATDCEAGDLTACDLLYQLAPVGHALESVGFTCGDRIVVGAVPDCRTRLG